VIVAYTPPHHCHVPAAEDVVLSHMNWTIPWDHKQDAYSSCKIYVNSSLGNRTVACSDAVNEWDYFGSVNDTIVSEVN